VRPVCRDGIALARSTCRDPPDAAQRTLRQRPTRSSDRALPAWPALRPSSHRPPGHRAAPARGSVLRRWQARCGAGGAARLQRRLRQRHAGRGRHRDGAGDQRRCSRSARLHRRGDAGRRADRHGAGQLRGRRLRPSARAQGAQHHHHAGRRHGCGPAHRGAHRQGRLCTRQGDRTPGHGHVPGHGDGQDRFAQFGRHRLVARHDFLRVGQQEQQQRRGRVPRRHRRRVRQSSRRIPVGIPAPHPGQGIGHRHHSRCVRRHAGRQRRAHQQPGRRHRHRRPVLRRPRAHRADGADGRRPQVVPARRHAGLGAGRKQRLRVLVDRCAHGRHRQALGRRARRARQGARPDQGVRVGRFQVRRHQG